MKNEISATWGIVCGSSSIDQETNNISLYTVLERFALKKGKEEPPKGNHKIPLVHEYIVLLQRTEPTDKKETFPLTFIVRDPKGVILSEAPVPGVFESGKKRLRIRIKNNAFIISVPGEYRFETYVEGKEEPITSTPLEVVIN